MIVFDFDDINSILQTKLHEFQLPHGKHHPSYAESRLSDAVVVWYQKLGSGWKRRRGWNQGGSNANSRNDKQRDPSWNPGWSNHPWRLFSRRRISAVLRNDLSRKTCWCHRLELLVTFAFNFPSIKSESRQSFLRLLLIFDWFQICPDTTPVLLCHGDSDPIVSYKFGQLSHSLLKSFMKTTQLKT